MQMLHMKALRTWVVFFYFPTSVVMVGITIDDGRMSDGIINDTIYDGRNVLTFVSNLSQCK